MKHKIVDEIYEQLVGKNAITVRLRGKRKVEDSEFETLIDNLNQAIEIYKHDSEIPKKLAMCLIDAYNQFIFKSGFYSEEYQNYLEGIAVRVQDLALELCDPELNK